jgi:hypothetical protein
MEVLDIAHSWRNGIATVTARVRPDGEREPLDLWYRFEGLVEPPGGFAEGVAAGLIVPCMFERQPLSIPAEISSTFLANTATAQRILADWYDYLAPVEIRPSGVIDDNGPRSAGIGSCFSSGVDSWYSLLKHEARISHLLLIRGFDIGLGNDTLWQPARELAATVAERLGKRLVTCETNLRQIADKRRCAWGRPFAGDFWGECLHGAALASIALLLRRTIGEIIVPATHTHAQLKPWGSSPLLDPWWSDGHVGITHDGCEATRVDKVRRLVQSDIALETLRVCYHDTPAINCGHCEKCLRTMMALRLCGGLARSRTFPTALSMAELRALVIPAHVKHHYLLLRDEARGAGDIELLKAIEVILGRRPSARQSLARIRRSLRPTALGRGLRMLKRSALGRSLVRRHRFAPDPIR